MDKNIDKQIEQTLRTYLASGVEEQVDYQKFYLYSIVTHSTAIEGSTVTEIENQLLFDEGISAKGRTLAEQMMNIDLKDAYLHAFRLAPENPEYTPQLLQKLSALVMRRTGGEYSTLAGQFDSSKGEFRLCNVSAGIGGRSYLAYNKVQRAVVEFCRWLNQEIAKVDKKDIAACYRLSFEAHFRLVTIHPWVDGNGRTTRLVMNMLQCQLGLIPSIVRKEDKGEYIQSLVDSRENEDSSIAQDVMMRHHINNLNRIVFQYQQNDTTDEGIKIVNVDDVGITGGDVCVNVDDVGVTGGDVCVNVDEVGVNVGVNVDDVGVNVGVNLTETQKKVYGLIAGNSSITHAAIARALSISLKTAERATKALRDSGLLRREGSDKTGKWIILK